MVAQISRAERKLETRIKQLRPKEQIANTWKQVKAQPIESARDSLGWGQALWARLNGAQDGSKSTQLPANLPPPSTMPKSLQKEIVAQLQMEVRPCTRSCVGGRRHCFVALGTDQQPCGPQVERLDREFKDASRERETKVRQVGVLGRAKMATEIRTLDDNVSETRRRLSVATLSLEMYRCYSCLEEEAMELTEDSRSVDDLALLVAELGEWPTAVEREAGTRWARAEPRGRSNSAQLSDSISCAPALRNC